MYECAYPRWLRRRVRGSPTYGDLSEPEIANGERQRDQSEQARPLAEALVTERANDEDGDKDPEDEVDEAPNDLDGDIPGRTDGDLGMRVVRLGSRDLGAAHRVVGALGRVSELRVVRVPEGTGFQRRDDLPYAVVDRIRRAEPELEADLLEANEIVARIVHLRYVPNASVGQMALDDVDDVRLPIVLGGRSDVVDAVPGTTPRHRL